MNTKHLRKGDDLPSSKPGAVRIYNMRYCPFAHRTKMALWHKRIPHDTINVNLKDKPDWFFEKNPYGTVPIIERDDEVIYESAACNFFLDGEFDSDSLTPTNKKEKYHQRMLMDAFSNVIPKIIGLIRSEDKDEALDLLIKSIQPFEKEVANKKFFGGSEISMLDIHTYPFLERLRLMEDIFHFEAFKRLPNLRNWVDNMQSVDCVKKTDMGDGLVKYLKAFGSGESPEYDYKIEEDPILKP